MMKKTFSWECECGHVENREIAPENCPKCLMIDSFIEIETEDEEE